MHHHLSKHPSLAASVQHSSSQALVQAEADDPLDAFMAEMQEMVDKQEAQPPKPARAELEEEEDNVADFMEASNTYNSN